MHESILVIGGAGFIGSNLTNQLLASGHHVTVLDNLQRRGAECNLRWLRERHSGNRLEIIHGSICDFKTVQAAAEWSDLIYHFAGQVAVTTSIDDPRTDFEVNAFGTFNVLEAARLAAHRPPVIFTSTNKVYGGMDDVDVVERETRYEYRDLPFGNPESQPLDFHSPYGCSKGAADQYVRDYARIYDLKTVVFRMSCIYGPRQFGNEDQGWLAHFMISTLKGEPISIFGDGKQVRDILFVEDLVRAFCLAAEKIDSVAGDVFNIGGGPHNTISVWQEFQHFLVELKGADVAAEFFDWRAGDQRCYVSDIRKAYQHLGWTPQVDCATGMGRLWDWIASQPHLFEHRVARQKAFRLPVSESA